MSQDGMEGKITVSKKKLAESTAHLCPCGQHLMVLPVLKRFCPCAQYNENRDREGERSFPAKCLREQERQVRAGEGLVLSWSYAATMQNKTYVWTVVR